MFLVAKAFSVPNLLSPAMNGDYNACTWYNKTPMVSYTVLIPFESSDEEELGSRVSCWVWPDNGLGAVWGEYCDREDTTYIKRFRARCIYPGM